MRRIAITGISGDVGRRVATRLLDAGHHVVGVDLHAPAPPLAATVEFHRTDVRDHDGLVAAFTGVDVVVHLAFLLDQHTDAAFMRDVNVHGTQQVARVAAETGVTHLVYTSSASAYGAGPGNDVPLTEESPLRARDLPYAAHKAEIEEWLAREQPGHPRMQTTVLRPAIVLGSEVENFIVRSFAAPRMPVIAGHRPPLQFVHVDDLADAVEHVIDTGAAGVFNVACEGWLSLEEIAAILDRRFLELPAEVAHNVATTLERVGHRDLPPGAVPYFMHPWVVSIDKLVATGWRPQRTNRDAVAELAASIGDRVVVGPVELSRQRVRTTAAVTAAVGALATTVGLVSWWRGRRSS